MIQTRTATFLQLQHFCRDEVLYALLDACDEPSVPGHCDDMTAERAVSLYRGDAQENYRHIAPYLARLTLRDLDWIVTELWKSRWGYFVLSRSSLDVLRSHFRRYLTVKLPDGQKVLFRFYDPSVLKTFLESSDPKEIREFFGPATAFGISSPEQFETISVWSPAP